MTHHPSSSGRERSSMNMSRSATIGMRRTAVCTRPSITFTIATVNIMNMDTSWLLDLKELVEGIVSLSRAALDACRAKIKVYQKQARMLANR